MSLFIREVVKRNGKWELESGNDTRTCLGYNIACVVIEIPTKYGYKERIFIRDGEAGIWATAEKIYYEVSPIRGDLWAVIRL